MSPEAQAWSVVASPRSSVGKSLASKKIVLATFATCM